MSVQGMWVVVVVVGVIAAVAGFFIGRRSGTEKARIEELETEVTRQKEEISTYKQEVEAHFDKTATLFVSMAGSYKSLFEHLSSGYEKLSEGSARELFKERVTALLLDGPKQPDESSGTKASGEAVTQPNEQSGEADLPKPAATERDAGGAATTSAADGLDSGTPREKGSSPAQDGSTSGEVKVSDEQGLAEKASATQTEAAEQRAADATAENASAVTEPEKQMKGEADEGSRRVDDSRAEVKTEASAQAADQEGESTLERAVRKNAEAQREAAANAVDETGAGASTVQTDSGAAGEQKKG